MIKRYHYGLYAHSSSLAEGELFATWSAVHARTKCAPEMQPKSNADQEYGFSARSERNIDGVVYMCYTNTTTVQKKNTFIMECGYNNMLLTLD